MAEASPVIVYVRDVSSGRVHKRFRVEGTHQLASFEGDNADTSGAYSVMTFAEIERTEREDLCIRCFGTTRETAE